MYMYCFVERDREDIETSHYKQVSGTAVRILDTQVWVTWLRRIVVHFESSPKKAFTS